MALTALLEQENARTSEAAARQYAAMPVLGARRLRRLLLWHPLWRAMRLWLRFGWRRGNAKSGISQAIEVWTDFLLWAKWWELGLPRETRGGSGLGAQGSGGELAPAQSPQPRALSHAGVVTGGLRKERISVVVLTKNEEARIGRCLESVAWADEVVVVDGQSQDRTVELCRQRGARVISHAFDGSFATDRNLGLEHAQGDWVLQVDADDVVTAEFRRRVEAMLERGSPHAALSFYRRSVLLGRPMQHGGWHYRVPNLVRRGLVRYTGQVHERPMVRGSIGELNADIEHHPCEDLRTFVARHNRYTSIQANEMVNELGTRSEGWIVRQMLRRGWKTWWKSYVKKHGRLEGPHGIVFAGFFAGVEMLRWAKYWERLYGAAQEDAG